jgi:GT2 family glycosyltransferase
MSEPALSVLMAVRNGGSLLEESLCSIAAQTFRDWEMMVVDDASTDETPQILAEWSRRDPRLRVLHNDCNLGQTASLNRGLEACRAPWIARQDADDISFPDRLARQMKHVEGRPDTVLLGTAGVLVDRSGMRTGLLDVPCGGVDIAWTAPFLNPFLHTAVLFRREVVQQLGGYDESFCIAQDYDLWTRLAAVYPADNLPERLVAYRHTETSLSRTGRETAFAEADRVSEREARRFFGRAWSDEEHMLVSAFRRGLPSGRRGAFWRMVGSLEAERGSRLPRSVRAAWHLRLAGADPAARVPETSAALRTAPLFAIRWMRDRWFSA